MFDGMDLLRDEGFWYTPHGKGRPMRHKVASQAADEIDRLTLMIGQLQREMRQKDFAITAAENVIGSWFNGNVDADLDGNMAELAEAVEGII